MEKKNNKINDFLFLDLRSFFNTKEHLNNFSKHVSTLFFILKQLYQMMNLLIQADDQTISRKCHIVQYAYWTCP